MKKILLITAIAGMIVGTSYGQGFVTVAGSMTSITNTTTLTSGWGGGSNSLAGTSGLVGNLASGQAYTVALLTSTASTPVTNLFGDANLATDWLDTGTLGHNTTFNGRFSIGSDYQVNNAPVGASQDWLLVAWSTALGADWTSVRSVLSSGGNFSAAGFIGWSQFAVGAAGAAPNAAPLIIQGSSGSIIPNGFALLAAPTAPVPEPSTFALAGLGAAALMIFRRKK